MRDKIESSFSDILKNNIKKSLLEYPKDFENFLNKMRDKWYEIKINKNISFKGIIFSWRAVFRGNIKRSNKAKQWNKTYKRAWRKK